MTYRRIFISFDHDDTGQVNGFLGLRNILDNFEFANHKLDHRINSSNISYVRSVIADEYIKPASITVVLIGNRTAQSSWITWEIEESLRQGKGLLGIKLKGSTGAIPSLIPNDHVGDWQPDKFQDWIDWAYNNR